MLAWLAGGLFGIAVARDRWILGALFGALILGTIGDKLIEQSYYLPRGRV